MKIIGFIGNAGSGKTTLCDHLCAKLEKSISLSFSDTMRNYLCHLFKLDNYKLLKEKDQYTSPALYWQDKLLTYGRLQQIFGTDICRSLWPDIWVRHMEDKIVYLVAEKKFDYVIIDSIRFINEARMLKKYGCRLIKLTRPGDIGSRDPNHRSETEMNKIQQDYELDNSNLEGIEETLLGMIS